VKFTIFDQPHPIESTLNRFVISTVVSLFVYGFLALLEPFHLNLLEANKAIIIVGYGIGCWVILCLFYTLLPIGLPSLFNESIWKVYKEILWLLSILLVVGVYVSVYEDVIGTRTLQMNTLLESIGKTLVIGIIPVTGVTLFNQFRLVRKHLNEANEIHATVETLKNSGGESSEQLIELISDNKGESFQAVIEDILFVAALGNYVEIFTLKNGQKEKVILRTPLMKIEEQLAVYPQFFRCHRTHLVNLNRIVKVEGNARGYYVFFEIPELTVPVSKRKTTQFRRLMKTK